MTPSAYGAGRGASGRRALGGSATRSVGACSSTLRLVPRLFGESLAVSPRCRGGRELQADAEGTGVRSWGAVGRLRGRAGGVAGLVWGRGGRPGRCGPPPPWGPRPSPGPHGGTCPGRTRPTPRRPRAKYVEASQRWAWGAHRALAAVVGGKAQVAARWAVPPRRSLAERSPNRTLPSR